MPEANVLYSVTAAVVLGLVAWVAFVLKTAKEPWARPPIASLRTADVPLEGAAEAPVAAKADADAKADEKAADAKTEAKADEKAADAKAEEKAEEEADAKKTDDAAKA